MSLRFPSDFYWGVSSSAYQIEGAIHEDGRGMSVWDTFCEKPGRVDNGEDGRIACDHYHRYQDDVALIAQLGVDTYRFSISWPRIQASGRGAANPKGLDFYSRLIDNLLEQGVEPTPTLFHWDLPQTLQDEGGWMNRDTVERFADYTRIVADALGDRVPRWITHNETFEHAVLGHAIGTHAPGMEKGLDVFPIVHHLLLSHGRAVQVLRAAARPGAKIGIAQSVQLARSATRSIKDRIAAHMLDMLHLDMHIDPMLRGRYPRRLKLLGIDMSALKPGDMEIVAQPLDFLGINYYAPQYTRMAPRGSIAPLEEAEPPPHFEQTDMRWPVDPTGLSEVMAYLQKRYGDKLPPIFITENGAAFVDTMTADGRVDDPRRIAYLDAHLRELRKVMDAGVDIRGYFVWSILDNFEWAEGYRPRFGLVHVDYATQQRTLKSSYHWYRDLIASQV